MRFLLASMFSLLAVTSTAADETVRYSAKVQFYWEPEEGVPARPHWSRLIAFAHSARYELFRDGDTASSGFALVATNGRVSVLEAELAEGRRRGRVGAHVVLPGLSSGTGVFDFELELDQRRSRIAFATMLAPSPDWVSGVSGINMRDEAGNWQDTVRVPLWVWDAGADSGAAFDADNALTQPRQSVRLLVHPAFLTPEGMQPIGHATFRKLGQ
jgi:hypothetical protein